MVKVLILGVMAVMLTGCVSPYHSMRDSEQDYVESRTYVRSPAYFDAGWYPWWSMDYFYLGSHHYRPTYLSSYSFSLFSGYPYYDPWFFPGNYSAWYAPYRYYDPWFGGYSGWGLGYSRYDPYWRYRYGAHYDRSPRLDYSGGDHSRGRNPGRGRSREDDRFGRSDQGHPEPPRTARNVSVAPSSGAGDRGMVIINRGDGKVGPNRLEPLNRQSAPQVVAPQSPVAGSAPAGRQTGQLPSVAPNNKPVRSQTGMPDQPRTPVPAVRVDPGRAIATSRRSDSDPAEHPVRRYSVPVRPAQKESGNDGDHP